MNCPSDFVSYTGSACGIPGHGDLEPDPCAGYITKDSGAREEFATGSRRDTRVGKGRFDLIPPRPIERLAGVYERGAVKYGDNNWQKGQPMSRFLDSMERHINKWKQGLDDEDHMAQAVWNGLAILYQDDEIRDGRLPAELRDAGPGKVTT